MKSIKIHLFALIFLSLTVIPQSGEPASAIFFKQEYQLRRNNLTTLLDTNSAAVLKAAGYRVRSNNVNYPYRQESNFLYLTGINEPEHYLMIVPKGFLIGEKYSNVFLFTPKKIQDSSTNQQNGEIILNKDKFQIIFQKILPTIKTLYISSPDLGVVNDWLNDKNYISERSARKELEQKYEGLKIKNINPVVAKLREIKTDNEIEQIKKAIQITGDGIKQAAKLCSPEMFEYELQAAIEYEMQKQGAAGSGFSSIIGSGSNSLILHYDKNKRQMKSGDVVVMDVGAEYNGYTADITRTIPVSGKFTKAQREIYNVVLYAQKEVIKIIQPGVLLQDLSKKAKEVITNAGYGKYIKHGVSHHLGLDVHDVWVSDTLKAGMVITVEPGIYIPEDATELSAEYRGLGIRIEDDVLVTENGNVVLSVGIPKEIDEIEKYMQRNNTINKKALFLNH